MEDYVTLVCSDEVQLVHCVREKALNALNHKKKFNEQ